MLDRKRFRITHELPRLIYLGICVIVVLGLLLIPPAKAWTLKIPTVTSSLFVGGNMHEGYPAIVNIDHFMQLKTGLSNAEKKLTTDLQKLVNSYLSPGQSREEQKMQMHNMGNLRHHNDPLAMKNGMQPVSDIVYVYISLEEGASTHTIDPYAWIVVSRDEQNHLAAAWVEINQLHNLVSLSEVRYIQTVDPPLHD
ncbi:hypothetical protein [Methanocella sp. MCL-LM]|uniref:hypothetical protein n=1 Tax=Methanocella sp. MCL-LM TaxID=3412035 RepID=UPI003C739145